ncbi:MAG: hypothetical protein Q9O24_09155 [Gammaproteobacteria bacterium]|nr:hypothetical protein [Gammaproteobacteria bacterium]
MPKIFVEVKSIDEDLDGHHGQLKRYFTSTTSVSLGILTNGIEYRFFTDTSEINIQDDLPFFVAELDSIDNGLDILARFQKDVFSGEAIREFATELTYTEKMYDFLKLELDIRDGELSESFMRWLLSSKGMCESRVTANVVDHFRPIAKDALQKVLRSIVRRSVAAIDEGVSSSPVEDCQKEDNPKDVVSSPNDSEQDEVVKPSGNRKGIVTTDIELDSFAIIKKQFESSSLFDKEIYNPSIKKMSPLELGYKDTTGYFGVYFNKPSWWIVRLYLEVKVKWIAINIDPEEGRKLMPSHLEVLPKNSLGDFRVKVSGIEDLHALSHLIFAGFEKTIQDRMTN